MFVVIEGPNGVGKSTVADALAAQLRRDLATTRIVCTAEPSGSVLGRAIRALEDSMEARPLALACAADRLDHVAREIEPAITVGDWIVCDRYVPSSLVLQRIDGLDIASIWAMNETALRPDLTVYLEQAPDVTRARLAARPCRSRLERATTAEREFALYRDARRFLDARGWRQIVIDCGHRAPERIAAQISAAARG